MMIQTCYQSTRGQGGKVSAATAILNGIAADGGLYVPNTIPQLPMSLADMAHLSYQQLTQEILQLYLSDFTHLEIQQSVNLAYDSKFDNPVIAPLVSVKEDHFLELFHGPTLAFKDMALTILPHLFKIAVQKVGLKKEIVILAATSGDTGKAALEGFAGVEGTKIIVFFPEYGVSQVQKRQMVTQKGDNTYVIGIEGNFDDAQNGVKAMFADESLQERLAVSGYIFSSANSINIGRLVPQIVYYFYAYLQLVAKGVIKTGERINMSVPTGNFGNILAGYYARKMGLPLGKLICASNTNKVLFDFFATGEYDRNREFVVTMSPSMDILISSNLERLLYHAAGNKANLVQQWMQELTKQGKYGIPAHVKKMIPEFSAGYATEEETRAVIADTYKESGYLLDTHTAVAYAVLKKYRQAAKDITPAVIVSTASPYKFPKDVMCAIDNNYSDMEELALLHEMGKLTAAAVPLPVLNLQHYPILHKAVCKKEEMQKMVENILGI